MGAAAGVVVSAACATLTDTRQQNKGKQKTDFRIRR